MCILGLQVAAELLLGNQQVALSVCSALLSTFANQPRTTPITTPAPSVASNTTGRRQIQNFQKHRRASVQVASGLSPTAAAGFKCGVMLPLVAQWEFLFFSKPHSTLLIIRLKLWIVMQWKTVGIHLLLTILSNLTKYTLAVTALTFAKKQIDSGGLIVAAKCWHVSPGTFYSSVLGDKEICLPKKMQESESEYAGGAIWDNVFFLVAILYLCRGLHRRWIVYIPFPPK